MIVFVILCAISYKANGDLCSFSYYVLVILSLLLYVILIPKIIPRFAEIFYVVRPCVWVHGLSIEHSFAQKVVRP